MGFGKFYRWSWLGWPNLRCILWGRQTTRLWNVYSYLDSLIALKVSRQFDFVNIEVGKSKIFVPLRPVGSSLSCKNNILRGHGASIFSNACDVYPTNLTLSEKRSPRDLGSKVYLHYARIRVAEFLQFSHLILLRLIG